MPLPQDCRSDRNWVVSGRLVVVCLPCRCCNLCIPCCHVKCHCDMCFGALQPTLQYYSHHHFPLRHGRSADDRLADVVDVQTSADKVKILSKNAVCSCMRETNWHKRKVKEAIYIRQRAPTMNRDQGYHLPATYNQIIPPKSEATHETPVRE